MEETLQSQKKRYKKSYYGKEHTSRKQGWEGIWKWKVDPFCKPKKITKVTSGQKAVVEGMQACNTSKNPHF